MSEFLDFTHHPSITSWVPSANIEGTDFPIQNLPFGMFRSVSTDVEKPFRPGVAIGDQILDLLSVRSKGIFSDAVAGSLDGCESGQLNKFMSKGRKARVALRQELFLALMDGSELQDALQECLFPQAAAQYGIPCSIGDYTDFYTGIHHATSVGRLFRPEAPLLPNYKWVPIGYHGRASSIGVSGQSFLRPKGQSKGPNDLAPKLEPSRKLDYELELGIFVGMGNSLGSPIPINEADEHAFGVVLLNDWSARDIQAWEYQPLGPFLAKNFATTISPWIITFEALEPFRTSFNRSDDDPQPLPYLSSPANSLRGAFDIELEVFIRTEEMLRSGEDAERLTNSNFRDAYWTASQMLTHHTVNGCNLQPGDLLGTGTQSGEKPNQAGSLLELTSGGQNPLKLRNGQSRTFLEDGDSIILRAHCDSPNFRRIGFGECVGTIRLP